MSSRLADAVAAEFVLLDRQTAALARTAGLACPRGCGLCCTTPAVETSVLEMLPMAEEVFRRGESELWSERAHATESSQLCLAYEHEPGHPEKGRCSLYAWRPPICRLYGFAGRLDKHGRAEFVACPVHEAATPAATERAAELALAGHPLPLFTTPTLAISALDLALGGERLPIRTALLRALDHVGLRSALALREALGDSQAG
jgi:Fe-S-cluster containining protein